MQKKLAYTAEEYSIWSRKEKQKTKTIKTAPARVCVDHALRNASIVGIRPGRD